MIGITDIIRQEIADRGPIPWVRFMDLALYHSPYGYYEQSARVIGKAGDFYTSVSVGSLFGELLAHRFRHWLQDLDRPVILETGAHDARLALDILQALQHPAVPRLEYWILEPSLARQSWQHEVLADFLPQVRWFSDEQAIAQEPVTGVIFAQEFLDALPCHRLGWDSRARRWFEWGVAWQTDRFAWTRLSWNEPPESNAWPMALLEVLPEAFTIELCPAARTWWTRLANRLKTGYLLTFDYGLESEEFFQPHRAEGTLRSYCQHHFVADVLANPGQQDITAMVDFTAIRTAGEKAGLKTIADEAQSRFLTRIVQGLGQGGYADWPPQKTRQFHTLTHPEHLGRAFRVLVQATLDQFNKSSMADANLKSRPLIPPTS
jgi:SAM-dependent MidA family methyltransferase